MPNTSPPNVLFILPDDLRADFLGVSCPGVVRTPNIDSLAERGVSFNRAYTASPICAPSRVSMATGCEPWRYGPVCGNDLSLPLSEPTLYRAFRDFGYRVGGVGKIDLRKSDPYNGLNGDRPWLFDWGFTHPKEIEGKIHACIHGRPMGPYGFQLQRLGLYDLHLEDYRARREKFWHTAEASWDSPLPVADYIDSYIGGQARAWLENVPSDFPWFLFVGFSGPHEPFDPPREYGLRFRSAKMPQSIEPGCDRKAEWVVTSPFCTNPTRTQIDTMRRQYCACIELVDDQIGMLLRCLQERGFAENTIIVFASDHGEMIGDHGMVSAMVPYEGALRVPLIVSGPGILEGGASSALVSLIDIYPTLCSLAGVPIGRQPIDGQSFDETLRDPNSSHRECVTSTLNEFRCLITDQYKLIQHLSSPPELYDLKYDPSERFNIADQAPAALVELTELLATRHESGFHLRLETESQTDKSCRPEREDPSPFHLE